MNKWITDFWNKYTGAIAWVYLLHGNTKDQILFQSNDEDQTDQRVDFNRFLSLELGQHFNYILIYNKAIGLQLLAPEKIRITVDGIDTEINPSVLLNCISQGYPINASETELNPMEFKDPISAFELFNKCMNSPYQGAIILDVAENTLSAANWGASGVVDMFVTHIRNWSTNFKINLTGNVFMIVCKDNMSGIHPAIKDLEAKIEQIYIPYPDFKTRSRFVETWKSQVEIPKEIEFPPSNRIAAITAGLNLTMIEDCLCRCLQQGQFDQSFIKERKDEVIRATYGDVIEIKEPTFGFEAVGGMDHIVEYFSSNVIKPMQDLNYKRCPMGILFSGPPGTGKSLFAEALAKEVGMLFVNLRFSKIFSKFVGDSEKNLDKILKAIENLSPVIVFIDEIDQSGHRRGEGSQGDSGVSARVFQRLLEFMAQTQHRGKILFLAATNRPDLLDPAMKRAGRFDRKIPFLAPNKDQRKKIIVSLFKKHKLKLKGTEFPSDILRLTENYVGADLETIVLGAYELADTRKPGTNAVRVEELVEAAKFLRPSVSPQAISEMSQLAIDECNDLRLVPERLKKTAKDEPDEPSHRTPQRLKKTVHQ